MIMAAEEANQSQNGQENGMENAGLSLLIVIGEPFSADQKDSVLDRVAKSLRTVAVDGLDVNAELQAIADAAPPGEEGPGGERIVEYSAESVRATILYNPQCQTVSAQLRAALIAPAQTRVVVYSGPVLAGSGAWILQDNLVSVASLATVFKENEVQNALKDQQGGRMDWHVIEEGEWSAAGVKKQLGSSFEIRVNPTDEVIQDDAGVAGFSQYLSSISRVRTSKDLLLSSDVVGNIRFTRPTLYVFPGAQGDSALFGISGFNLLINAGYSKKACFWGFTRHLDRIDALLLTHLGADNIFGVSSVFERKAYENVHPEIGYVYFNAIKEAKNAPNGDISPDNGKPASLIVNLVEQGNRLVENIKLTGQAPQPCLGTVQSNVLQPLNLYHKVGHGTLDMYILNPSQDSKELKDFLNQWSKNVTNFTSTKNGIPLPSQSSISALLVWKPTSPNEKITRILFPGNTPQQKIFEGLDKLKTLDIFKHPSCSENSLHAPKATKKSAPGSKAPSKAPSNSRASPVGARSSPVPSAKEAKKPLDRKPPPSASSKTAKTDVRKKPAEKRTPPSSSSASKGTSPAASKGTSPSVSKGTSPSASKGTSPSASKGTSPAPTPASTATPSNTPIETTTTEGKEENVAAEVAASLESEFTSKAPEPPASPEVEVKPEEPKQEPEEAKPEEPVISPDDVSPVVEATPVASEANTADLLGDLSSPPAPIPDLLAAEAVQQEQAPASPDASPMEPESDESPSVESGSSFVEEPKPVPEPVQEPEPIPQSFTEPEKELAAEPEKDEDTAELEDSPQPTPSIPEADLLGTSEPEADLLGSSEPEATQPNGLQNPVDTLMDSPKALPDPLDQNSFDAVAMSTSFSEDRGENLFSQPQKELEDLPEAEQPQVEDEQAKVDEAFDEVLKQDDIPQVEQVPVPFEDDQVLPTTQADTVAPPQEEEETPVVEPEEKDVFQEKFLAESEQVPEPAPVEEPAPVDVPASFDAPAPDAVDSGKSGLEEYGVLEDDATLQENLNQADSQTLKDLGIYDEPEADQPTAEAPVDDQVLVSPEADQTTPAEPLLDFSVPDVISQRPEGDVEVDSLADIAGVDSGAADSLECLATTESAKEPEEQPIPEDTSSAPEHSFEIVDAPKEVNGDPFTNPFVGVDLNSSSQPNPFNIPDSSSADTAAPPVCDFPPPGEQAHIPPPPQDTERDSLERDEFNPVQDWGHPMGLPAPDDPSGTKKPGAKKPTGTAKAPPSRSSAATSRKPTDTKKPAAADAKKAPSDRAASPRKPMTSTASRTAKKPADDAASKKPSPRDAPEKKPSSASAGARKPAASKPASATKSTPTKAAPGARKTATTGAATKAPAPVKLAPVTPFYVDLSYVPGHGDSHYLDLDFFRRVRARHYVVSALEPAASLFDALLEAKQTWDDPSLEVTVIPTYDTDTLRHWMALHRDQLADSKIDFAPSASRCTIQLQDHEASCAAYRLEF